METKYNLEYWINGKLAETILESSEKTLCKLKKKQLQNSTHKFGKLKLVKIK